MTSAQEGELIRRAKRGDPAAFAEIYDRFQPAVYRYVSYRVGEPVIAEDLTSEVFVRLVEKIDRYTPRGRPLLAWLYTIARNLVTDHRRRAGRFFPIEIPEEQLLDDAPAHEEVIERRLAQRRLAAAISQLTEDQRRVILLRFGEGLDSGTAAQVLGKSVGATKALQHRALAALRRLLVDRNQD